MALHSPRFRVRNDRLSRRLSYPQDPSLSAKCPFPAAPATAFSVTPARTGLSSAGQTAVHQPINHLLADICGVMDSAELFILTMIGGRGGHLQPLFPALSPPSKPLLTLTTYLHRPLCSPSLTPPVPANPSGDTPCPSLLVPLLTLSHSSPFLLLPPASFTLAIYTFSTILSSLLLCSANI